MQKQLAAPDRLSVWFSAQYLKALLSVGLRRFLFATLSGSFALTGLFFSMQASGQGWQAAQSFEGIAFASANGDRSRLNSPGGCGSLDGGTISEAGPGGGSSADLEVTKFVDKPTPREGDTIVYTIFLANLGPDNAASVRVRDILPGGVTYAGAIPSRGDYDPDSGLWSIDNLSKCGNATLTLSATVNPGTAGETITNTASYVSAEPPDSNPGNNVGEAVISIQLLAGADLAITKTVNVTNPNAGDTIIYTVTVFNNGPDDATGVEISDTLPISLTFSKYLATQGIYTGGFWAVGNLGNTATATLMIEAKVNTDTTGQVITNTASILAANQTDPITYNNARQVTITVASSISRSIYLPVIFKDFEPLICNPYDFNISPDGWLVDNEGGVNTGYTKDKQKYFIERNVDGIRIVQAPISYANYYTVEVDIHWDSTNKGYEYGLIFGQEASANSQTYRFGVDPISRTYRVRKGSINSKKWICIYETGDPSCWVPFSPPTLINKGAKPNHLKIECNKSSFSLYINNHPKPLWQTSSHSCRGKVGIFAQSSPEDPNGLAYFDNFRVSCSYSLDSYNLIKGNLQPVFPTFAEADFDP
ncbi:MAG: DUF11 domain-containing protein [Anaerolineae bacterium]|nr:DUF11 domain-containing protein [Anaerolineae bacterium]